LLLNSLVTAPQPKDYFSWLIGGDGRSHRDDHIGSNPMDKAQNRRAKVRLPPWLWGSDLPAFAKETGLKLHQVDASTHRWEIETLETYEKRSASLCEVQQIAGQGMTPNWSVLANLPSTGLHHSIDSATLAKEQERIAASGMDITSLAGLVRLTTIAVEDHEVAGAVRGAYEAICAVQVDNNGPAFPDAAVHFVRFDQVLGRRAAMARVLLRVEEEPELLEAPPTPGDGELVFGSGWLLQADLTLTRDAFIGPLMLCMSPWVWAFSGSRIPGVIVFDLGKPMSGRANELAEIIQLFISSGNAATVPRPEVGPAETAAGLNWWVKHLNDLLSAITDPASFVGVNGEYGPRRQFEVLLSIEQLGRRIVSILASERDLPTRRLLGFAALDTLDGLGFVKFDQACRLSRAETALTNLEASIPQAAASMLLPTARRAVEGLRACQAGFLASSKVSAAGVSVPDKKGGERVLSKEDAVAQYLRIVRNGNHGFTGENDGQRRRDEILLTLCVNLQ
jgi:hypothetical protein